MSCSTIMPDSSVWDRDGIVKSRQVVLCGRERIVPAQISTVVSLVEVLVATRRCA